MDISLEINLKLFSSSHTIKATEYDHTPTLIDLQSNLNRNLPETETNQLGFLPYSSPFQLDWPHHITFDQKNLSRFSSPSSNPINNNRLQAGALDDSIRLSPTQIDLNLLLSSSFPVLKTGFVIKFISHTPFSHQY